MTASPRTDPTAAGCPDIEALLRYAAGELGEGERDRLDAHIDACPRCAELVVHAARELSMPPSSPASEPALRGASILDVPDRVGRYVLLERIGVGGMGMVYAAYDPRLQRRVAVKLIRRDRADREADARLRREARALATLAHPNVVTVFEVGTLPDTRDGDGDVYLVMELVAGTTLRRWWSSATRTSAEIVEVFVAAGRGLAAAHAAGLVHRDFKPDNVLIDAEHGERRVRVGDFGLARALPQPTSTQGSSEGTADPRLTSNAGTPSYMAPEQSHGLAVDARADQYAFCVSLWEALTGQLPSHPVSAKSISARLRSVLARGLQIDPSARWPDMDALLAALHPRSRTSWRLAAGVLGSGVVVAALSLRGQPSEVDHCAQAAAAIDEQWGHTQRDALSRAWSGDPTAANAVIARIDAWTQRWQTQSLLRCDARVDPSTDSCSSLALVELATVIDLLERAPSPEPALLDAIATLPDPERCAAPGERDTMLSGAQRLEVARLRRELAQGQALWAAHRIDAARAITARVLVGARALDHAPLLAEALHVHARVLHDAGDYDGEREAGSEGYLIAEAHGLDESAAALATSMVYLVGAVDADFAGAQTWARHAAAAIERLPPEQRPRARAELAGTRGHALFEAGRTKEAAVEYAAAIEYFEHSEPGGDPLLAGLLNGLGTAQMASDPTAALASFERALAAVRAAHGDAHPRVAMLLSNIGAIHNGRGDHEHAEHYFSEAVTIMAAALGEDHVQLGGALVNLGVTQANLDRPEAARASYLRAAAVFSASLGPDHPDVGNVIVDVGALALEAGELDEAERRFVQALTIFERTVGAEHPYCRNPLAGLAEVALERGQGERALELARRALVVSEAEHGDAVLTGDSKLLVARALAAAGQQGDAIAYARAALQAARDQPVDGGDAEARAAMLGELAAGVAELEREL